MFNSKPKIVKSINHFDSLISADTTCNGGLLFTGSLKITGTVLGGVIGRTGDFNKKANTVSVDVNGMVVGDILADNVIVEGTVEGNIVAKSVALGPTAKIKGKFEIHYDLLQIEPGAEVVGVLVQNKPKQKAELAAVPVAA